MSTIVYRATRCDHDIHFDARLDFSSAIRIVKRPAGFRFGGEKRLFLGRQSVTEAGVGAG
jgi:hypothetical protein